MKFNFYVIVGSSKFPAETTCSAWNLKDARDTAGIFSPTGAMPTGEPPKIYSPGTEVPVEIASNVISPPPTWVPFKKYVNP